MKKISVITVTYNCINTIEATINSVLGQNYDDYEYIIIDGGSTDGTYDVIKKYSDRLSYCISEPDSGIYDAMNKGLEAAKGQYVYFLNGDDTLAPNVLKTVSEYMKYTDADVIFGEVLYGRNGKYRVYETLPIECMNWMMPICHQSVFMKKAERRFDLSYKIAADYKMLNEMYNEGCSFQYIPCVIGTFKQGGESDDWHRTGMEITDIACKSMLKYGNVNKVTARIITEKFIDVVSRNLFYSGNNHKEIIDFIKAYVENRNEAYIWCTGKIANNLFEIIKEAGVVISGVVDSSYEYIDVFHDFTVESPEILVGKKNCAILILTDRYCDEIRAQINDMNLDGTIKVYDFKSSNREFLMREQNGLIKRGRELCESFDQVLSSLSFRLIE